MAVRSPHGPAPNTRHWGSGREMETRTDETRKHQKDAAAELHGFDEWQATETGSALCCGVFRRVCKRRSSFTSDFIALHGYFCKRHVIKCVSPLRLDLLRSSTILNNKLDDIF